MREATLPVRDALASLPEGGGKRPRPPYGGRANLQKSDGGRVPYGFASLTGWRPSRGQPVPPGAGETPRPARGGGRHPHGSDSPHGYKGERTYPPYIYKGGSDALTGPKGIVASTRKHRQSREKIPIYTNFGTVSNFIRKKIKRIEVYIALKVLFWGT